MFYNEENDDEFDSTSENEQDTDTSEDTSKNDDDTSQNESDTGDDTSEDNEDDQSYKEKYEAERNKNQKLYARLQKKNSNAGSNKETNSNNRQDNNNTSDRDTRVDLRLDGYTNDEVDFIMKNGGKKALNNEIVKTAIEGMRNKAKSREASQASPKNSPIYKKYTADDFNKMSAAEMEKILPKAD